MGVGPNLKGGLDFPCFIFALPLAHTWPRTLQSLLRSLGTVPVHDTWLKQGLETRPTEGMMSGRTLQSPLRSLGTVEKKPASPACACQVRAVSLSLMCMLRSATTLSLGRL